MYDILSCPPKPSRPGWKTTKPNSSLCAVCDRCTLVWSGLYLDLNSQYRGVEPFMQFLVYSICKCFYSTDKSIQDKKKHTWSGLVSSLARNVPGHSLNNSSASARSISHHARTLCLLLYTIIERSRAWAGGWLPPLHILIVAVALVVICDFKPGTGR